MAESPRPMPSAAFQPHHHQLPPPIFNDPLGQAARFSGPGPILPPLAISSPVRSTLPQPLVQQSKQPSHIPQQQHSQQQHISTSSQTPHKREVRQVSTAPYGSVITSQTTYNSPANSGLSSPASYDFGVRYDDRRYSQDSDRERRRSSLSTMVPSPTYNVKRSVEHNFVGDQQQQQQHQQHQQHQHQQQPNYPSRYTPTSVEDAVVSRRPSRPQSSPERYTIQVRQQPVAARACGFGERDRRVIDPPPIVQLIVNDPTGHSDPNEMRYPFNVVHCTLWSSDGNQDETALIGVDKRLTRRLMGTLVSSPFVGQDEEGKEGCFFCFPDLSCRTHGKYRLRFVLMRLEPSDLRPEGYTPIITEAMSEVFTVYTAKEFPGMRPSTELTKALKLQGCAISVKKGNEKAIGAPGGSGKDEGSGDDEASPSTAAGKPKRRRKV
ncbi:uncharacterized protein LAJ45_02697 [Morchella importuna]|nr:uncharacterized protein LAJ45_02697 [Morchella importuna]KAH8153110.1 hypothetical protein LAJ45_02697 [Morchella importuna]